MTGARPTYRQYERKKLGYHDSAVRGILYMCRRSFQAASFAGFWRNWNPLFSYYLLYYCYQPLRQVVPRFPAVVLTFALSGAVHDLAATLIRGKIIFLFTPVFVLFGSYLMLEEVTGFRMRKTPFWIRPLYHLAVMVGLYFLAKWMMKLWI